MRAILILALLAGAASAQTPALRRLGAKSSTTVITSPGIADTLTATDNTTFFSRDGVALFTYGGATTTQRDTPKIVSNQISSTTAVAAAPAPGVGLEGWALPANHFISATSADMTTTPITRALVCAGTDERNHFGIVINGYGSGTAVNTEMTIASTTTSIKGTNSVPTGAGAAVLNRTASAYWPMLYGPTPIPGGARYAKDGDRYECRLFGNQYRLFINGVEYPVVPVGGTIPVMGGVDLTTYGSVSAMMGPVAGIKLYSKYHGGWDNFEMGALSASLYFDETSLQYFYGRTFGIGGPKGGARITFRMSYSGLVPGLVCGLYDPTQQMEPALAAYPLQPVESFRITTRTPASGYAGTLEATIVVPEAANGRYATRLGCASSADTRTLTKALTTIAVGPAWVIANSQSNGALTANTYSADGTVTTSLLPALVGAADGTTPPAVSGIYAYYAPGYDVLRNYTGSVNGATGVMTVTTDPNGGSGSTNDIRVGDIVTDGTNVVRGTVLAFGTGSTTGVGKTGTYMLSSASTVASTTLNSRNSAIDTYKVNWRNIANFPETPNYQPGRWYPALTRIATATNEPQGIFIAAVGGTQIANLIKGSDQFDRYWMGNFAFANTAFERIYVSQGESNAELDLCAYQRSHATGLAVVRALSGQPWAAAPSVAAANTPAFYALTGRYLGVLTSTDAGWTNLRKTELEMMGLGTTSCGNSVAAGTLPANVHFGVQYSDAVMTDDFHYTDRGTLTYMPRLALSFLNFVGLSAYDGRGPLFTTASRSGAIVDLPITLNGAASLTTTSGTLTGLTGWTFKLASDGSSLSPSSVVLDTTNQRVRVTFGSAPSGPVQISNYQGRTPDVTNLVLGNYSYTETLPATLTIAATSATYAFTLASMPVMNAITSN